MQYGQGYDISFKHEGVDLELLPSTYSFTMVDSIYETYPKGEFILKDDSGVLQEFLFTVEGTKYELTLGFDNKFVTNPFIVKDDELEENLSQGIVNGSVRINLIHEFKDVQDIQSKYYKDKISNIVKTQAGNFPFSKLDIEATGNDFEWYQLLKNQVEFVNENLLPFAFSNTASKSPFFYFIDSYNQYNFKSFKSMIKGKKPIQLTLTAGTAQGSTNKSILAVKRLRKGLDITYDLRHRKVFSFDGTTGDLLEADDYILDYPENNKSLPIIADKTRVTSYFLLEDSNADPANKENLKGLLNDSMRNSMTLDRFVITLPFNPEIVSGIPVELVIPSGGKGSSSNDFNLSGIYLAESVTHVWDGANERANTYAVIGRKDTFIPNSLYDMKKRLIV